MSTLGTSTYLGNAGILSLGRTRWLVGFSDPLKIDLLDRLAGRVPDKTVATISKSVVRWCRPCCRVSHSILMQYSAKMLTFPSQHRRFCRPGRKFHEAAPCAARSFAPTSMRPPDAREERIYFSSLFEEHCLHLKVVMQQLC